MKAFSFKGCQSMGVFVTQQFSRISQLQHCFSYRVFRVWRVVLYLINATNMAMKFIQTWSYLAWLFQDAYLPFRKLNMWKDRMHWLYDNRELIGGLKFVYEPPLLRFFMGGLEPVNDWPQKLMAKFKEDFGESLKTI